MQRTPSSPTTLVIDRIAASRGVDPQSLPPLAETIDPAALEAVARADAEATLTFVYAGHDVTVENDGTVAVSVRE